MVRVAALAIPAIGKEAAASGRRRRLGMPTPRGFFPGPAYPIAASQASAWAGSGRRGQITSITDTGCAAVTNQIESECIQVSNDDAFAMARRVTREEGILAGGSCGTAMTAALEHPVAQMIQMTSFVYEGVFDRFPKLRVGFLEAGTGWVPYMIDRLDRFFAQLLGAGAAGERPGRGAQERHPQR